MGWPLVETYHAERRGPATDVTRQSLENSSNVARINHADATGGVSGLTAAEVVVASRRYGNHLGVEFGARYASSAIIGSDRAAGGRGLLCRVHPVGQLRDVATYRTNDTGG